MRPSDKRRFGRSGLEVTAFAFGTAPVGNFLHEMSEETSDAMFQRAWEAGVRFYDTAPMYGHGLAELRTGQSLRWKTRDGFVVASKVGRELRPAQRGILATGARPGAKYNHAAAPAHVMAKVAKIEAVGAEYAVPLPAAALQFVVAHPAVPSFCAGTRNVEQLDQNLAWFSHPIPSEFWAALKARGLLREDAPVPA